MADLPNSHTDLDTSLESWELVPCDAGIRPGVWCCRKPDSATNCCSDSSALVTTDIGKIVIPTVKISGTSTDTSPAATGTEVSLTPTAEYLSKDDSACSNHHAVVVGAGVGASLGVVLVASVAILIWRERTRPSPQPWKTINCHDRAVEQTNVEDNMAAPPAEMDSAGPIYEVDGRVKTT